jgi:hypothetical protein
MGPLRECVDLLKETDGRADTAYDLSHAGRSVDVLIVAPATVIHAGLIMGGVNHAGQRQTPQHQSLETRYPLRRRSAYGAGIELDNRSPVIIIQPLPNLPGG